MTNRFLKILGAAALLSLAAGAVLASSGTFNFPSNAVTDGEIVVGTGTHGAVQGTTTPAIAGSLTLGASGTALTQVRVYTAEHTAAAGSAVSANACSEVALTVTGITTADKLLFTYDEVLSGAVAPIGMRASAADTAAVQFCNVSGSAASSPNGTFTVTGFRS